MKRTDSAVHEFDFRGKTLLIADDNPTNLKVLFEYLEQYGLEILIARDGESAVQRALTNQPDLILLDVVMPGMDGFQTCLRLKAQDATRDIPVIFMTALSSPDNKVKGFEVGGIDYVTKPLQYEEVLARVSTHLRIRNLQQRLEVQNTTLVEKNQQLQAEVLQRRRIEKRLKRVNQQLKEANASKDKLFSIIAHDLRAPFAALLALSETVIQYIDEYTTAEIRDNMVRIRTSSEAVYALLENLLAWSRLQRGLLTWQPATLNLTQLIAENMNLFRTRAEQKHITLISQVSSQTCVYADKSMFDAIMRNLLSNALKFTPAGGTIAVSERLTDAAVEIAVADTGMGIAADDLAYLFQIEAQYTQQGTAGEPGTGLGLNLCKELVEKSQGQIWVESDVGQGAIFRFTLPVPPTS